MGGGGKGIGRKRWNIENLKNIMTKNYQEVLDTRLSNQKAIFLYKQNIK